MVESFQPLAEGDHPSVAEAPSEEPALLELHGVSVSYGGVPAVADISFPIRRGTIHALVGENGAGKSTLVQVLTGIVQPDEGALALDGELRWIGDPQTAHRLGIVAMYQEPTVFPDLTVA